MVGPASTRLQLGTQPTGKYALQSIIKRTLVKVCKRTILGLKSTFMLTYVLIGDLPTLRVLYFWFYSVVYS